jgi:hypothetical protein
MYGGHPKVDADKINTFRITQLPIDAGGVPDVSAP